MGKVIVTSILIVLLSICCSSQNHQMVEIKGGTFEIKSIHSNNKSRTLQVQTFLISKYELTNKEWNDFGKKYKNDIGVLGTANGPSWEISPDPDMPVMGMSWYAAIAYCNWRSLNEGLEPVYVINGDWRYNHINHGNPPLVEWNKVANGYRLPTVAEWLYVYTERGQIDPIDLKTFEVDFFGSFLTKGWKSYQLFPVGQKKSNNLGMYDLIGNVSEWCWDFYSQDWFAQGDVNNQEISVVTKANPFEPDSNMYNYYKSARVIAGYKFDDYILLQANIESFLFSPMPGSYGTYAGIRLVKNSE